MGALRNRLQQLRAPLASRDFVVLLIAQTLSEIGDWAARVALAVLVLERTDSAAMTGLVVTMSVLPWVGIGQLLATLGDRIPRRALMIGCDLLRAAAFIALVIPMPVGLVLALTFLAALPTPPFAAARAALLPETVPANHYPDAIAVSTIVGQATLVVGYLMGGVMVAAIGARGALVVNSLSFLLSAVALVRLQVGRERTADESRLVLREGAHALWSDLMIRRAILLYALVSACGIIPESLAAVYALKHLGTGDAGPGVLAAAVPIGTIAISSVMPFHGQARTLLRLAAFVAVGGAIVALAFFTADPDVPVIILAFIGVGIVFGAAIPTNTVAGTRLPNASRASAFGLAQGALLFAEGTGAAIGGIVASLWGVRSAMIGAMVAVVVVGAVCAWRIPADDLPVVSTEPVRRTPPAPPPRPLQADI